MQTGCAARSKGHLETAKKLLLDYAREVGQPKLTDDAIQIAARLSEISRAADIDGADVRQERSRVTKSMLALVRELEAVEHAASTSADAPEVCHITAAPRRGLLTVLSRTPTQSENLTRLEAAKQSFEAQKFAPPCARECMVGCDGIGKSYGNSGFGLRDVTLDLRPGELLGLVGENGAGKTTLLRILAGALQHSSGTLTYPLLGAERDPVDWASVRPLIAYVEQAPPRWYGRLKDTLHLTAAHYGTRGAENQKLVAFWLHRFGLDRYADYTWNQISGGYKMRFELARAMLCNPKLLILDEPLAPLDVIAQRMFLQDLSDLAASRRAPLSIVVSSQHLYEIELVADKLLFLSEGGVGYYGAPNAFTARESGNLFELACDWEHAQLTAALLTLGECVAEEFGHRFLIRAPTHLDANAVLTGLVNRGAKIEYFHDLTRSTRRLFEENRRHG